MCVCLCVCDNRVLYFVKGVGIEQLGHFVRCSVCPLGKLKEDYEHKVSAAFMNTHPSPLDSHENEVDDLVFMFCYYKSVKVRFLSRAPL